LDLAYKFQNEPDVQKVHEFLNIVCDFSDPKEAIREAISNSIDWGANEIKIEVIIDNKRPDEEVIIKFEDNGKGLNDRRLKAFFDLGNSTALEIDSLGNKISNKIGEKGHGTKIYFNSRQIEVFSRSEEHTIEAIMPEPLATLYNDKIPSYSYDLQEISNKETGTIIIIRGYNQNKKNDFEHDVLKDYILWFTKFGSIEKEFNIFSNSHIKLSLKGLGSSKWEDLELGHLFAEENSDIKKLRSETGSDWTDYFVRKWVYKDIKVAKYPGVTLDLVFYIEGSHAKWKYNSMIRRRGVTVQPGMYTVEDRYGLYACKDFVPIQRVNEWISTGQQEWTKYHAFVNCQRFNLTANRGSIGNTRPDLLEAIRETLKTTFEEKVRNSLDFQAYISEVELEKRYVSAKSENADFSDRIKRLSTKKVACFNNVEVLEPRREAGVLALFAELSVLQKDLFPFRIVDYDTAKGYDALCTTSNALDLSKDQLFFVEFKFVLKEKFDHSFEKLAAVVCWNCNLGDGTVIEDLVEKKRTLHITPINEENTYTKHMLVTSSGQHNIEVFVLKTYLQEKLNLDFKARTSKSS
jgi:hypothetical protein